MQKTNRTGELWPLDIDSYWGQMSYALIRCRD